MAFFVDLFLVLWKFKTNLRLSIGAKNEAIRHGRIYFGVNNENRFLSSLKIADRVTMQKLSV